MTSLLTRNLKPVVGTVVTINGYDDTDLEEFLEENGNQVLITSREGDMFWGDVVTDKVAKGRVDLPYHFEFSDIESVDYINTDLTDEERHYTKTYIHELVNSSVDNTLGSITDVLLESLTDHQLAALAYVLATHKFNTEMEEI